MLFEVIVYSVVLTSSIWVSRLFYINTQSDELIWHWIDILPLTIACGAAVLFYGVIFWMLGQALKNKVRRIPARAAVVWRHLTDPRWRRELRAERKRLRELSDEERRRERLSKIARRCKAERQAREMREIEGEGKE
jgi:hypothetical protein